MATEQQQRAMKTARPLVYDVDSGTLRFCKTTPRASLSKSRARSRPSPLNEADPERTLADDDSGAAQHKLRGCGVESGESSPTCVIQNSAVRSNSSSPTMSSGDPGSKSHDQEGRRSYSASSTATTKSASAEPLPQKTPAFKSIQSAAADKTPGTHKPKKISNQSSIMHKAPPEIFSFNATYMTRVDGDGEAATIARRTTLLAPLLKPTPSKWDDAEKWVPGSESLNSKSRSGPLLAQMVASQAGMLSKPFPSWKPHLQKPLLENTPHTTPPNPDAHTVATDSATDPVDEKLSIDSDGAASPSCMNGSFMNLGVRHLQSSTRDMGTAMTPLATSVEPSRSGTPGRDESVVGMTEEEMVEKTRQEIVALGTRLGKARIAAAWAQARDHHEKADQGVGSQVVTLCGDSSRVDAWKEAETAKFTIRFQQEEAKIAAWEAQEKAKVEAEVLRAEAKAELMKTQAHEKRANKVAATVRRGEKLRHEAETRRTEATAKVTRKAELMKRHGKITNLLFLSLLCT